MMYTLLYVDDEPGLLDIGRLFLEESGEFSVVTIDSASAALHLLRQEQFDAIISDYQMPEMDGIGLLKQVRQEYGDIPFILFTGRGREDVVIEAINNGVDFYVQKGGDIRAQFADLAHLIKRAVERRRVGEALDRNRQYLNQIFSSVREGILIVDAGTGQIIDLNPAAAGMIETTRDRILHQPIHQCICPDDAEHMQVADLRQGIDNAEGVLLTARGERVPILRTVVPFIYQGRACLLETIVDNTERKRNDELLRTAYEQVATARRELQQQNNALKSSIERLIQSEERFRELSDLLPVPVFETDMTGTLTFTNRAVMKVIGYTSDECRQGIHILDIVREDERQRAEEVFSAVLAGELPQEGIVCTLRRKDGRMFPAILHANRILDRRAGTCTGLRGVILDISRRKVAEQGLLESGELHSKLIATIPDIIVQTALDGTIVSINDTVVGVGGYADPKDLIGKNMFLFFAPEDLPKVIENTKLMFEQKLGPVEYRFIKNDGTQILLEVNGDVLRMPDGGPRGMVFVCRDITDRKQAEVALQQANRKLRLLSSVTRHDISNQMMVLMGHISLLQESRPDAGQDVQLRKITEAAERVSAMIRFTREYEEIGITAPVWQEIRALIRRATREAPLGDLKVTIDLPDYAEVLADPLIVKGFYNLMENATRSRGAITTIRFSVRNRHEDRVIIYEDDGDGVPAEEKEKIFWQGFGKNTGLGLFLTREILSITGITIHETGEPGKGAQFEITIPRGMYRIKNEAGRSS